jgi:hypothetical protein
VATNGSNGNGSTNGSNGNGHSTEEVWLRQSEGRSSGEFRVVSESFSFTLHFGFVLSFVNVFLSFFITT